MNSIKIIKLVKANLVRIKIHKLLGVFANVFIYTGYLLKMSKWIDQNNSQLQTDDFYNSKVRHGERINLYQFVSDLYELKNDPISYIEFGVGRGNSLRWWTSQNDSKSSKFWAFDTFEGLPEKYGAYDVGTFSLGGKFPDIDDARISFEKGLFQDSLLPVIKDIDFTKKVIVHMDGDLHPSTIFPFSILYPHLKEGDIILFDEFGVPAEEFRAFDDMLRAFYIKLKPIGAINNYLQVAFEITSIKSLAHLPKK